MQLSGFDLRQIVSEEVIGQCGSTWATLRLKQVCVSPICCWPRFACTSLAGHVSSVKKALVGRKNDAHE